MYGQCKGLTDETLPLLSGLTELDDLGIDGMQNFLDGYQMKSDKLNGIMPLVKAFNVTNYAAATEEAIQSNDKTRLDQFRTRLSGTLDLYSF